jgi:hypothetical protein
MLDRRSGSRGLTPAVSSGPPQINPGTSQKPARWAVCSSALFGTGLGRGLNFPLPAFWSPYNSTPPTGWRHSLCWLTHEAEPMCGLLRHVALEHETHLDVPTLFGIPSIFESQLLIEASRIPGISAMP